MQCSFCHNQLGETALSCSTCGKKVREEMVISKDSKNGLFMGGMEERQQESAVCHFCGWQHESSGEQDDTIFLSPGVLLKEKYIVGKVLCYDDYVNTYLAMDIRLGVKSIIMEYYPSEFASRNRGQEEVIPYSAYVDFFNNGLGVFLEDAYNMVQLKVKSDISIVRDIFQENGTAYMVNNYYSQLTLEDYLNNQRERVPFRKAVHLLVPLLQAIE